MVGRIYFAFFDSVIELFLEDLPEGLAAEHLRGIKSFLAWHEDLLDRLQAATFAYYQHVLSLGYVDARELPVIERAEQVWRYCEPSSVEIEAPPGEADTYARLGLHVGWEIEHGMEWVVKNGCDILYVGPFESQSVEGLMGDQDNEWNFASRESGREK